LIARFPCPHLRRVVASLGLSIALGAGAAAPPDNAVVLNFVNADIESVIRAVSEISGRNFVVDPRVKGVVNIVSARPVPRSLVYPTLLSALRLQGYTAIEAEGVTKIVPEADARQHGSSVTVGPTVAARGDRLVTQVYTLGNESAAQMVAVLRPLITPNNTIAAFPSANALVITDYAENLRRIDRIVATLDQGSSVEPLILPLRHASALDVAQTVSRLLIDGPAGAPLVGTGAEPIQRNAIIAEPRSNSVIVRADNAGRLARIRAFVEQLDAPARAGSNIRIVYLRNADAVRVAQTLRAVLTGTEGTAGAAPGGTASSLAPVSAIAPATGQPVSAMIAPLPASGASAASIAPISTGSATIYADPSNNALVISAPEPVYNNLREVIDKLDVRRAQVYVEALVAELTAERAAEFGVQWQFLDATSLSASYDGTGRPGGGTNFGQRGAGANIIDAMTNLGSLDRGLNIGLFRGQISIPGIGTIANLGVLVRALEGDANANILSMPNLLTLDNEPAQVVIGQNIPIVTGSYTQSGTNAGSVNPFQTFERRDVGLTLRVRPQITEGGSVKMQIFQEVSSVAESQPLSVSAGGVITNKRALESTVLVDDGQIIVLGGLLQDSLTDGAEAVPVLGTLPVVGPLFRYDSRRRAKTNLMVFLRPRVIRTPAASQAITTDRYDYVVGEQRRSVPEPRFFWQDRSVPLLPGDAQWSPTPTGSAWPSQPQSGAAGTGAAVGTPGSMHSPDPVQTAPVPLPSYPAAPSVRVP
jgi:general secretion pathway protein D